MLNATTKQAIAELEQAGFKDKFVRHGKRYLTGVESGEFNDAGEQDYRDQLLLIGIFAINNYHHNPYLSNVHLSALGRRVLLELTTTP